MDFQIPSRLFYRKNSGFIPIVPANNVESEHESSDDEIDEAGLNTSKTKTRRKKVLVPISENECEDSEEDSCESLCRWPRSKNLPEIDKVIPATDDEDEDSISKTLKKCKKINKVVFTKDRFQNFTKPSTQSSTYVKSVPARRKLDLVPMQNIKPVKVSGESWRASHRAQQLVKNASEIVNSRRRVLGDVNSNRLSSNGRPTSNFINKKQPLQNKVEYSSAILSFVFNVSFWKKHRVLFYSGHEYFCHCSKQKIS